MGNQWGLGLHFVFVTIILVATTNTCLGGRNITVTCFEHERLALLKFKHSVSDYASNMLSSWVGNDCCSWERVMCDYVTGNVESLHLRAHYPDKMLASNIEVSSSLGELRHLKYLDLSLNNFQCQIPKFIGTLKQLTYLNLSYANFHGTIPPHIGNLSNLATLDLSAGYILSAHDMSWISGLSSLQYLDLSGTNLSGAKHLDMVFYMIPSLEVLILSGCYLSNVHHAPLHNSSTLLSNITYLDLSKNSFKGQLPPLFMNMTSLQFLDLSASFDITLTWNFANFTSMNPSLLELRLGDCNLNETYLSRTLHNFTTLSNLQRLDLAGNDLKGPLPTFSQKLTELELSYNSLSSSVLESVGKFRLLQVLDLSGNELRGSIPESIGRLVSLTTLLLYYNYLSGTIPVSIGQLSKLQSLDVSDNQLYGTIPVSIGQLSKLQSLGVSENQLNGTIPVSIGQLSKLRSLDVSRNSLEGVVSESHFANLSMLKDLNTAYNNKLTFNVSREWLPPFQLLTADLSFCKIENGFPHWLRNQRKIEELRLVNASISGPLPTWFRKLPLIPIMSLCHNNLSGPLTNLPSGRPHVIDYNILGNLFLQNNFFSGSIPRLLCKYPLLCWLNLSKNRLTGKLPDCLLNMQNLVLMKLSSNGLSGVIPSSIGRMSSLESLNLNDNKLIGELPVEIWNLSRLWFLDVGDNALSGKIPESIGVTKSLKVFRLHNNNFTGEIPQFLCRSSRLQILDVAHNNLAGYIPPCLGELQGMVNIGDEHTNFNDWSEEGVSQVINGFSNEYTSMWTYVANMDLSSNKLVGEIPVQLTALCALVGLNLSNNHLSGGIPANIGNMKELFSLDLSENELAGLIPPSIAALTFLSHLNLSNNNLSGQIPTGNQLQTLIDPSIYAGNKDLCGTPLPKNCSNPKDLTPMPKNKFEAADQPNKVWFYVDIMSGFATGFWGIIVVLILKKQWRSKLFLFAEESMNRIHVEFWVIVNKMKRGREAI